MRLLLGEEFMKLLGGRYVLVETLILVKIMVGAVE